MQQVTLGLGNMAKNNKDTANQLGAGLIEVMAALLILAIGLLGLLGLQANGLNSNQRAVFVTEAQLLAQDMADRILASGNGDTGANTGQYSAIDTNVNVANPACQAFAAGGCDEDELIDYDHIAWQQALNGAALPSARGIVNWSALTSTYTIRVLWDQDRTGALGTACGNDKDLDLTCFDLELQVP